MRGENQQGQGGVPTTDPGSTTTCHGVVVAVADGVVTVQVNQPEACDVCRTKESCHQAHLAGRQVEVRAEGFKAGDKVRLLAAPRAVLKASMVLYLFPALFVLTGSFAGYATATSFFNISGDIGSLIGVAVGLGLGILFVHTYKVATGDGGFDLTIERYDQE